MLARKCHSRIRSMIGIKNALPPQQVAILPRVKRAIVAQGRFRLQKGEKLQRGRSVRGWLCIVSRVISRCSCQANTEYLDETFGIEEPSQVQELLFCHRVH